MSHAICAHTTKAATLQNSASIREDDSFAIENFI